MPRLTEILCGLTDDLLNCRSLVPQWLVRRRTVLITKADYERLPGEFRPIACLNTVCQGEAMVSYRWTQSAPNQAESFETETPGVLRHVDDRSNGVNKQNCLDRFQKMYDRVPHAWMFRALKSSWCAWKNSAVDGGPSDEVGDSIWSGRTRLWDSYRQGEIQQGQGHTRETHIPRSISLWQYCGVSVRGGDRAVTHLLYMDNLKVYAESGGELQVMMLKEQTMQLWWRLSCISTQWQVW